MLVSRKCRAGVVDGKAVLVVISVFLAALLRFKMFSEDHRILSLASSGRLLISSDQNLFLRFGISTAL